MIDTPDSLVIPRLEYKFGPFVAVEVQIYHVSLYFSLGGVMEWHWSHSGNFVKLTVHCYYLNNDNNSYTAQ